MMCLMVVVARCILAVLDAGDVVGRGGWSVKIQDIRNRYDSKNEYRVVSESFPLWPLSLDLRSILAKEKSHVANVFFFSLHTGTWNRTTIQKENIGFENSTREDRLFRVESENPRHPWPFHATKTGGSSFIGTNSQLAI